MIDPSKDAVLSAAKNFSAWMDIRKRLVKSRGGMYLHSLVSENDEISKAFEEFKSGFFLKHYMNHEDEVLSQAYVAFAGNYYFKIIRPAVTMTFDTKKFLEDSKNYGAYQDGYIILDPANIDEKDPKVVYELDGIKYTIKAEKKDLWNIFDEFALFSGLERYDGETNKELENRILAAFKRPANSSAQGLRNAIKNAVMNYVSVDDKDIKFETPNGSNMLSIISDGKTIYDELSDVNQDIARTKVWGATPWENTFKKVQYIPNEWDKPLESGQPGTGQRSDLKIKVSGSDDTDRSTDLLVYGYKSSPVKVNEYIRRQGIVKTIPLTLTKYKNELKSRDVSYRITAVPAAEVSLANISLSSYQHVSNSYDFILDGHVLNESEVTKIPHNILDAGEYRIEFRARDPYGELKIGNCSLTQKNETTNLLTENNNFKLINGYLTDTDVKAHIVSSRDMDSYDNVEDLADGGFTIGKLGTSLSFDLDVTGCQNLPIKALVECQNEEYTNNRSYVTSTGKFVSVNNELVDKSDDMGTVKISLSCRHIEYELKAEEDAKKQGTISVQVTVDGTLDSEKSGAISKPGIVSYDFDHLANVEIVITKMGQYPVTIRNIRGSQYDIKYELNSGDLVHTANDIRFPDSLQDHAKLTVKVTALSTFAPVIKYIHIGPSLENVVYKTSSFKTNKNAVLDINEDKNCRATLIKITDGTETVVSDDYSTHASYVNNTGDPVGVFVDTSELISIKSSNKRFYKGVYHGNSHSYFILEAGEELYSISMTGERNVLREKKTLRELIGGKDNDHFFVSSGAKGMFLVRDGKCSKVAVPRSAFLSEADKITFENLPDNIVGVFDTGTQTVLSQTYDGVFSSCYIESAANSSTYIAYNKTEMFQPRINGVSIVNTFYPSVSLSSLLYYQIDMGDTVDATAEFSFNGKLHSWALGNYHDGITVRTNTDLDNSSQYQISVTNLDESFILSNNMELQEKYTQNGIEYELARYIITPPDDMSISYTTDMVQEEIIAEDDGFNKLFFSNVDKIELVTSGDVTVSESSYTLLDKQGIIIWKDDTLKGSRLKIRYSYEKPRSLRFKSIDSLYDEVGYSIDAYSQMNQLPLRYSSVKDGENRTVSIDGVTPDKLTVRCSEDDFYVTIDGANITVHRYPGAESVTVHNGYYYDDNREYYFFEHDSNDKNEFSSNIIAKDVQYTANTTRTVQESSNFVKNSSMIEIGHNENTCLIDCVKNADKIRGVSSFGELTACDTYQLWTEHDMKVSFGKGYNGSGLYFSPTKNYGYALLDITEIVNNDYLISLAASASIKAYIFKEVLADGDHFSKSIYAEKIDEFKRQDNFLYYHINDVDEELRYYLYISGNGMIDDLIGRKYNASIPLTEQHKKYLSVLNYDIEETPVKNSKVFLPFDVEHNDVKGLEIAEDGTVETGSSVDWGITLIRNLRQDFADFKVENVALRKNELFTEKESGRIVTPWVYIGSSYAVSTLYVKVNDLQIDPMRYFTIRVRAADDMNGLNSRILDTQKKTNIFRIETNDMPSYVQIEIEMQSERVIDNLEIYARYVENSFPLSIRSDESGSLITKIYNAAAVGKYRIRRFIGTVSHPENIAIFIRGYRQDDEHDVWTQWYRCMIDKDLYVNDAHVFDQYQYFQFKIEISDMNANIKINKLIFEVV